VHPKRGVQIKYPTLVTTVNRPMIKIRIYKTIILPVVLYRCETWSPTLREEHRLCLRTEEDIWTGEGCGDG
jgi:hypothetical protein